MTSDASIPNRARFKPSEVCTIAGVQPYILRSWEAEFPALGTGKGKNGGRIYRRSDVELVLKIKSLVFGEGLTLGAARRRLEGLKSDSDSESDAEVELDETAPLGPEVEKKITTVRQGLRELLEMLGVKEGAAASPAEGRPEPGGGTAPEPPKARVAGPRAS